MSDPALERDRRRAKFGAWVVETCLLFGTTASTAYKIASLFVSRLEHDEEAPCEEAK